LAPVTPAPNDNPFDWAAWVVSIPIYLDPSGTVVSTRHVPVPGAKVVLERATRRSGPFTAVPKGSLIMSPSNRRNPDHTTRLGGFGWDVTGGFYLVTAQHPGCTAGHRRIAKTSVRQVPPPVSNLRLTLKCPHLHRTRTRTTLKAKVIPVHQVIVIATVRGHHPEGLVRFTRRGRTFGYAPLNLRTHQASLTVLATDTHALSATYEGDGNNAPSTGRS
jgi:hypothetical protein